MSRVEAAAKAYKDKVEWIHNHFRDDYSQRHELAIDAALSAVDAHDAVNGVHRVSLDDATVERAEVALYEHRQGGLTCYDHDTGWCCVCGTHEIAISRGKHIARAVLAAAVKGDTE